MNKNLNRLQTIDALRGFTMLSMIVYHFCWDLKYLLGLDMPWYGTKGTYIWQQSICWTFILISGFCLHFAKKQIKNGIIVFMCGLVVTCATILFVPEAVVMFGVLTMLSSCMLLVGVFRLLMAKISGNGNAKEFYAEPFWGFFITAILFSITKTINYGYLNLGFFVVNLPRFLYEGAGSDGTDRAFLTYLGFMQDGFYSSDYFSLIPWLFLFLVGYYLYGLIKNTFAHKNYHIEVPFLSWFGRHSLIVYMLHQPVLYLITLIISRLR